jgi:transcriptional regulator with XRE-family HTH domain
MIQQVQELLSVSQTRLAELLGVTGGYLSRVKSGKVPPSLEICRKLATFLQVPTTDVLIHFGLLEESDVKQEELWAKEIKEAWETLPLTKGKILIATVRGIVQVAIQEHKLTS